MYDPNSLYKALRILILTSNKILRESYKNSQMSKFLRRHLLCRSVKRLITILTSVSSTKLSNMSLKQQNELLFLILASQ
ncbi:unnamed protein product [Moneuplotes crassus]|uniref:Uncharacterized protein n=1 Tax=Euplotes crassus TaxID=5936 RepID=A0AAD2D6I5_EUPCR|nr:unnamed protein product [Moneuplotes crassus]